MKYKFNGFSLMVLLVQVEDLHITRETCLCLCTGAEGKAGMAAIADPSHSSDLEKLVKDMEKALPPYARPVFIRFLPEVNKTGKLFYYILLV